MEMTGEFRIPAPRQRVWEGLNDPEILKSSIPGCQTIEKVSDTEFTAKVLAQVGPVKANFAGKVTLSDLDPPQSYTIAGEGSGGVAGFAKGSAKVNLDEDGGATVLHYAVQAHVGGKLAQIGSRLIDSVARRMAENFFARFVAAVAPGQPAMAAPEIAAAEAASTSSVAAETAVPAHETGAKPKDVRLPPVLWVTGLAAIIGGILYFFTGRRVTR
ncbi:MAG: carbon monoxide dehydrogenase subunit G [Stellaceae bacterium]